MPIATPRKTSEQYVADVPSHLAPYITGQTWEDYRAEDHATWSRLAEKLSRHLARRAVPEFLHGVDALGLRRGTVPELSQLNAALSSTGWAIVPVDGMLPARVWLELVARGLSPAVVTMRPPENLRYTSTPDFFHDVFGHSALLLCKEYADMLRRYAQLACRVVPHGLDPAFPFIKRLSEVKVSDPTNLTLISELKQQIAAQTEQRSEAPRHQLAQRLAAFGWWVVEYGMLETTQGTRIYGASLCSSLDESQACLRDCRRAALTLAAFDHPYDATSRQDELFVCTSFSHLHEMLDRLADDISLESPPAAH
jgi:phenylalanine-4-hydroxylase